MKDLKQHIEESLLDDFETIEAASKKDLDMPFLFFYKIYANTNDWDSACEHFDLALDVSNAQKYDDFVKPKRGEVSISFLDGYNQIFVYFEKSDIKPRTNFFAKDNEHFFTMYPNPNSSKPRISFVMDYSRLAKRYNNVKFDKCYILTKKQSELILSLINGNKIMNVNWWHDYWLKVGQ